MKKLVLIDGNSLLNRAYYATPVFTTKSGTPTNAIFGFVKLLFKILGDIKPEYIIVAFDLKAPTFRHKMFDGYKATRKSMPDELAVQVEPLKNLLKAMNIAICSKEGMEADDVIGTLSKKFDVHSYIYTGDRDSFQLVDEKTDVHFTKKGVSDLQKLNINNFKAETGLTPSQIIDLKALMGDKSDNIPGVPGIGEKTALSLLAQYSDLDGVYENLENIISNSVKSKLTENRESAFMSYKLATIDRNCELDISLENCTTPLKYGEDVKKLFKELEFNSFLSMDIFEESVENEHREIVYPEKIVCKSFEEAQEALEGVKELSVELNVSSMHVYNGKHEIVLEVAENLLNDGINTDGFINVLELIFSDKSNRVTLFNCKSAMHVLKDFGIDFECDFEDVSLLKYLCDYSSKSSSWGLKELCETYLYDYEFSAFAVHELYLRFFKILESEKLVKLYSEIEKPLLKVLFEMEICGVRVSSDTLKELTKRYELQVEDYRKKIFDACGCTFNLNSPTQLGDVLYNKLGIKEVKKKKAEKFTTSAEVLEKLCDDYPVIADILKYRMYQKLYSTYLEGIKPLIGKNSIVHTTFNQSVTATGRLSSANPNLQNIPIRENEGKELRKIFIPRDGNIFIDADYSQIELRLLAHFSGCKELIEAYNSNKDIHAVTASQVFGIKIEEVTEKLRRAAKAVNFGIIYGISEFGLSKNLGIPVATAREYIQKYFETYSAVKEYMNKNVAFAKENGYVSTLTGRKRFIPEIKSANFSIRQFGERAAMNMPLQGSSADIIKIAMINVNKALKKEKLQSKLILQVHDELVLDAPKNEEEVASEILKREMENAVKLNVPLTVDVHSGKNWYEAK